MKIWYYGVCKEHKEAMVVMVTNPVASAHYLSAYSRHVQAFLDKHYGCTLELWHRDDQLDHLWPTDTPIEQHYTVFNHKTGEQEYPRNDKAVDFVRRYAQPPQVRVCSKCHAPVTASTPDHTCGTWICSHCGPMEDSDTILVYAKPQAQ